MGFATSGDYCIACTHQPSLNCLISRWALLEGTGCNHSSHGLWSPRHFRLGSTLAYLYEFGLHWNFTPLRNSASSINWYITKQIYSLLGIPKNGHLYISIFESVLVLWPVIIPKKRYDGPILKNCKSLYKLYSCSWLPPKAKLGGFNPVIFWVQAIIYHLSIWRNSLSNSLLTQQAHWRRRWQPYPFWRRTGIIVRSDDVQSTIEVAQSHGVDHIVRTYQQQRPYRKHL